jgi:RecJ-like exonuclease
MDNQPKKWVICEHCEGNGKVENPAFSNGFTSSEWADMDQDAQDGYMRGDYDVRCNPCGGSGKVQVPDVSRMTFGQKRAYVLELREREEEAADLRDMHREMEAERRFGC